jgi:hypothetical protein
MDYLTCFDLRHLYISQESKNATPEARMQIMPAITPPMMFISPKPDIPPPVGFVLRASNKK